jgi:hypothetical protein
VEGQVSGKHGGFRPEPPELTAKIVESIMRARAEREAEEAAAFRENQRLIWGTVFLALLALALAFL